MKTQSVANALRNAGILFAVAACCTLQAQQGKTTAAAQAAPYLVTPLPNHVFGLLVAHGDRLQMPGNERLTLSGTLTDAAGVHTATVTAEIPGKVLVQISGAASKTLRFDGNLPSTDGAALAGGDQDLLESFQADVAENFFFSFGRSASVRFLGGRYRTDGGTSKNYTGPWYDIYELVQPVAVKSGGPAQQKFYYFDSVTGQFAKTRYKITRNGKPVEVQTVFSNWTKTKGQSVPGKIERLEDGKTVFSFAVSNGTLSPTVADDIFKKP